jgi:hypothetical protein
MILRIPLLALLASLVWAGSAQAMSFRFLPIAINNCTTDCPKVIVAEGEMFFDDINTLVATIQAGVARDRTIRPVVLLSSIGGNVAAGYGIADVFRQIRATVIVGRAVPSGSGYGIAPGGCASACVFALMGGAKRIVPPGSKVGVHWMSGPVPQISSGAVFQPSPDAREDSDAKEQRMRQFMRRMGVRPEFAGFIRKVPHTSLHVMTTQEMSRFGLAQTQLR